MVLSIWDCGSWCREVPCQTNSTRAKQGPIGKQGKQIQCPFLCWLYSGGGHRLAICHKCSVTKICMAKCATAMKYTWMYICEIYKIYTQTLTYLRAVHKCQHLHERTKHTLSETPSPQKRVHINIFECQKSPWK